MFTIFICLVITVAPISAAVTKHVVNSCSSTEFACGDGGCVSAELVCDGNTDCADGLDEASCGKHVLTWMLDEPVIHRYRRQSTCRKDQWQCRDGSCISFDGKCDGIVDCADESDETHALCRKNVCQYNWFRCTYGACVDGNAPCNGEQDCADNSDELLPRCRNETDEVRGRFKCLDGTTISAANHCDGVRDCPDGSDETVRSCAGKKCPQYLFQCAYGACVDSDADCNKVNDCADGSDEAAELCDKSGTAPVTPVKPQKGNCVLPPYPDHGTYVTNVPNGRPGEAYDFLAINVTCRQGYGVEGSRSVSCYNGWWPEQMPKCVSLCHLTTHASVEYNCLVTDGGVSGIRACKEYEPHGTVVSPSCRAPNYYSPTALRFMHCIDGIWDYVAICTPGLTKNGTNITILVKDTVEVHVSDITYVVPINNNQFKPVVPITDNSYGVIPTSDLLTTNRPITNRLTTNKPINYWTIKTTSSKPSDSSTVNKFSETSSNKPYDNSIDTNNQNIDSSSDEIDINDWRMGVPDNRSTKIPSNSNVNKAKNPNYYTNYSMRPTYYSSEEFTIDTRFGDSTGNKNASLTNSTTTSKPKQVTETKIYTTKSNHTNIYFNINNSSVNVHADGKEVFKN